MFSLSVYNSMQSWNTFRASSRTFVGSLANLDTMSKWLVNVITKIKTLLCCLPLFASNLSLSVLNHQSVWAEWSRNRVERSGACSGRGRKWWSGSGAQSHTAGWIGRSQPAPT